MKSLNGLGDHCLSDIFKAKFFDYKDEEDNSEKICLVLLKAINRYGDIMASGANLFPTEVKNPFQSYCDDMGICYSELVNVSKNFWIATDLLVSTKISKKWKHHDRITYAYFLIKGIVKFALMNEINTFYLWDNYDVLKDLESIGFNYVFEHVEILTDREIDPKKMKLLKLNIFSNSLSELERKFKHYFIENIVEDSGYMLKEIVKIEKITKSSLLGYCDHPLNLKVNFEVKLQPDFADIIFKIGSQSVENLDKFMDLGQISEESGLICFSNRIDEFKVTEDYSDFYELENIMTESFLGMRNNVYELLVDNLK